MKILATGATGTYASHVVRALTQRGADVRAVVHDQSRVSVAVEAGAAEIVEADLSDPATLPEALRGVDGVFLITPAFHPDATRLGLNLVEAAVAAGIRKVVYNGVYHPSLSLINHACTRAVEEALYVSSLDFTVLQPAMYVQALADTYRHALDTGEVVSAWSKHSKMSYVDYRDVAEVAAIALTEDEGRLSYGTFELAAGGQIDRVQIAALMSRAANRELVAADSSAGAAADDPDGLAAMFADYDRHGFHGGNSLVLSSILQRPPRSVADYVAELGDTITG